MPKSYSRNGLRLLAAVDEHEIEADEDERDAEPLAHVEGHAILEADLILLEELYEEAEGEDLRHAEAEEEALTVAGTEVGEELLAL